MGAAAAGAVVYDTTPPHLHQIPSPAPSETTTDRGDSASSGSAETNRVGEMLMWMMQQMGDEINGKMDGINRKMDSNVQALQEEMQCMGMGLQNRMEEVKQEMKWEINTVRAEVSTLEKNVKGVVSAMEAGKEEMAIKIITVGQEIDKLRPELGKVKEGQDQIKRKVTENTEEIERLKGDQEGTKGGINGRGRRM